MYCKNCGNKLNENEKFCSNCGVSIEKEDHIIESNSNNKKNNNSKIIIGIIVVVLIIGYIIFLSPLKYNFASGNINAIGIRYVEDKYNDNCKYVGPYGDSMTGTREILVKCNKLEKNIVVKIENYKHKLQRKFSDSYLSVKYENDTILLIEELVAKAGLGESIIFLDSSKKVSALNANISFEKFIKSSKIKYSFIVEIKKSKFLGEEQIEKLKNLLVENNFQFSSVIAIVDDTKFGLYNESKLGELLVKEEISSYRIKNINK